MKRSMVIGFLMAAVTPWGALVRADGIGATSRGSIVAQQPSRLYFRGRPLPKCRNFLITELGFRRIISGRDPGASGAGMSVDLGLMRNVSPGSAGGLCLYHGAYDEGTSTGFRARYRYWRPDHSGRPRSASVELGAGLLVGGTGPRRILYPCPLVSASVNFGDWVAFTAQFEWLQIAGAHSEVRTTVGTHLGSYAALVGVAGALAILLLLSGASSSMGPFD
jgi:hypothetical protein